MKIDLPFAFDARGVTDTIRRALTSAGLDSRLVNHVDDTLRHALCADRPAPASSASSGGGVIDVPSRVIDDDRSAIAPARPALDESLLYRGAGGQLGYKLHVPANVSDHPAEKPALLVMLHGCTQSPDDFSTGTRMNALADRHGFVVAYPEQVAQANPSKCWNWFQPGDQERDRGEPTLMAGMVREIAARQDVDPQRIFVAGLSAGAAMAVVLGQAYPELFAAVGAHSGLPYRSAQDIPSAMAAMKGGRGRRPAPARGTCPHAVPTIVFHGDRDHTVHQSNGAAIVGQALEAFALQGTSLKAQSETSERSASTDRAFTRALHTTPAGAILVESWTLHGAGHAWSGGDALGSYTDIRGPDASEEMLRFFLALPPVSKG